MNDQAKQPPKSPKKSSSSIVESAFIDNLFSFFHHSPPGHHSPRVWVLALSSGRDSQVLLHLAVKFREIIGNTLCVVAHVNHGMRPEADEEEHFVEERAREYGLPFYSKRLTPPLKGNLEAWGRDERYAFLKETADSVGGGWVLTAHHANDRVEGFLMKLFSGRAARDPHGLQIFSETRSLARPLWNITRESITQYCHHANLSFIEDLSNEDTALTRNFVRRVILPPIKGRFGSEVLQRICLFQNRLAEDEEYLNHQVEKAIADLRGAVGTGDFIALPAPLRWRLLARIAIRDLGSSGRLLGYKKLHQLQADICRKSDKSLFELAISNDIRLFGGQEWPLRFIVSSLANQVSRRERRACEQDLAIDSRAIWSHPDGFAGRWEISLSCRSEQPCEVSSRFYQRDSRFRETDEAWFSAEMFPLEELVVRAVHAGDQISCIGRGRRKVFRLLKEFRVPPCLRANYPVIACGECILWVPGIARSDYLPVDIDSSSPCQLIQLRGQFKFR